MSKTAVTQEIIFIQSDVPPLRAGNYKLTVTQTVPNQDPGSFKTNNTYIVQGPRFSFPQDSINSVFPPNNSNGEYDGVLPHVVFNKRTLPWQRVLKLHPQSIAPGTTKYMAASGFETSPWLAVLLFNDDQVPKAEKITAKDLIAKGTPISVTDSSVTGTGTMADNIFSYTDATLNPLAYGETPDDSCNVIDIPLANFNMAAPSADDMQFLGHIREVDVADGSNADEDSKQFAVVVGNRVPLTDQTTHAFLVSLENFADYLPDADGIQSSNIPSAIDTIRLLCYRSWSYTANTLDQKLENLLENLNKHKGTQGLTTLQLPITGTAPTPAQVNQAMSAQASGSLTSDQATTLVQNALAMGYTACNHHLRHGGNTVSMYRGPLAPYAIANTIQLPIAGPDAINRYNPETGIFDVSYGMAWQLGQLLALQNNGFANALYEWKRSQNQQQAMLVEQDFINNLYQQTGLFDSIMKARLSVVSTVSNELPEALSKWLGKLALLQGVPFNYLVPDERMLPQESLRFLNLDFNWIDALIDGAFSIGRTTTAQGRADSKSISHVRLRGYQAMYSHRKNHSRVSASFSTTANNTVTGFLLRSQAVSGWPNLRIKGFSDTQGTNELHKLHLTQLSKDTLFGLFSGDINMLIIEEPPEQLHLGVEGKPGVYSTTLREVQGNNPGKQYTSDPTKTPQQPCNPTGDKAIACIATRSDQQTLQVVATAQSIEDRLINSFSQSFPKGFSSAEFALEMTKGVVRVEYQKTT